MQLIRLVQIGKVTQRASCARSRTAPASACIGVESVYELVLACLREGASLSQRAQALATGESLLYDDVYSGAKANGDCSRRSMLRGAPERVLVSGTGLTHLGSAKDRQAMHARPTPQNPSQTACACLSWALPEGVQKQARLAPRRNGSTKGTGISCSLHRQPLTVPAHAEDGGEEAEIAGIYLIANDGTPYRIGMCAGNEFSDHRFERRNYLNLAGSKLRQCSIGPELVVGADFPLGSPARSSIERDGMTLWKKQIETGEENMSHSLANLEHHHFKFDGPSHSGQCPCAFFWSPLAKLRRRN